MIPDLLPALYAALKAEPNGLTLTGLEKRLPYTRSAMQGLLYAATEQGYVIATVEPLRPGDTAPACRYRLRGEG